MSYVALSSLHSYPAPAPGRLLSIYARVIFLNPCFRGEKADEALGILGYPYPALTRTSGPGNPLFYLIRDASGQLGGLAALFFNCGLPCLPCLP